MQRCLEKWGVFLEFRENSSEISGQESNLVKSIFSKVEKLSAATLLLRSFKGIFQRPCRDGVFVFFLTHGPKNIARTNPWIKHISYSRLYFLKIKTYLFKIFKNLFRKAKLWSTKKMTSLFITVAFFSPITKETEKTLRWNTFNKFTTLQFFLNIKACSYINLKLVPTHKPQICYYTNLKLVPTHKPQTCSYT